VTGVKTQDQVLRGLKSAGLDPETLAVYMVAQRALIENRQGKQSGWGTEDAQAIVNKYGKDPQAVVQANGPSYDSYAKEMRNWWEAVLDIAAKRSASLSFRINKIRAANLKNTGEAHGYYIPFSRVIDQISAEALSQFGATGFNPMKRFKGETAHIKNPFEAYEDTATTIINAANRNFIFEEARRAAQMGLPIAQYIERVPKKMALAYKASLEKTMEQVALSIRKNLHESMGRRGTQKQAIENITKGVETGTKDYLDEAELGSYLDSAEFLEQNVSIYMPELKPPKGARGKTVVPYMNGDKLEFWEVHPDLPKIMNANMPAILTNPIVQPLLSGTKRLVQLGATTFSPTFQFANLVFRDFNSAFLNAKGWNPFWLAQETLGMLTKQVLSQSGIREDSLVALANRLGVITATRYGSEQNLRIKMGDYPLHRYVELPMKAMDFMENILSIGERANRLSLMSEAMKRKGLTSEDTLSTEDAIDLINAYQRGTTNFAKQGHITRIINTWVPFFGARMAEVVQAPRNIERNPGKAAGIAVAYLGLGVTNALRHKDDAWFKNLDPSWRTGYFMTSCKDENQRDRILAIPLSTHASVFYAIGHALASYVAEEGVLKPSTYEYLIGMAKNHAPVQGLLEPGSAFGLVDMFPVPAKIAIEEVANKKFFSGGKIIPDSLKFSPPAQQTTPDTTELAKKVSGILGSIFGETSGAASPKRVEHILSSVASGPFKVERWAEKEFGANPINEQEGVPLIFSAVTRPGFASSLTERSHNMFYDALNKYQSLQPAETIEEGNTRKKLVKITGVISDINKTLQQNLTPTKRDELYQIRQDMFTLGISIAGGSDEPVPSFYALKAEAKNLRAKEKQARSKKAKNESN
jgi:hypothetical protein